VKQKADKDKRFNLLVISPWADIWSLGEGAGVSDDYYFIEKAVRRGLSVHFLRPRGDSTNGTQASNHSVHYYPNFFRATRKLPAFLKRIIWPVLFNIIVIPASVIIARRIRPGFILGHSHYTPPAALIAARAVGAGCGIKLFGVMDMVHTEWNYFKYLYKNIEQVLAMKIPQDTWIILDDGTCGRRAALRRGIPGHKIHFLPNGINVEWADAQTDRRVARKKLSIKDDACAVLFLARLVPSKRPETVVRAIPEILRNSTCEVQFIFAGDGPLRSSCAALAKQLGIDDSIRFLGTIPHREVPDLASACDIFVATSNLTNMAIPTCEAMLCGLPVVAFDVGDTSKTVIHERNGILVQDGDTAALSSGILKLIEFPEKRKQYGREAKAFGREHFTGWDARTDMEMDIIEKQVE